MCVTRRLSLLTVVFLCACQLGCASWFGSRTGSGMNTAVTHTTMRRPTENQDSDVLVWREGMEVQWSVQSASAPANQSMAGKAVVGPDGTLELGPYGSVHVAGLTDRQAQSAVANHVRTFVSDPQVTLIPVFATSSVSQVQAGAASDAPNRYTVNQTAWRPYQPVAEAPEVADTVVAEPAASSPAPVRSLGARIVSFWKGS